MTSYADDLNRVVTAVLKARQAEIRHYRHSSAGLRSRGMPVKERYDTPLDRLCDAVLDGVEPFVLPDDAPPDTDEIDMTDTELTPRQRFHQLRAQGVSRYQAAKAIGIAPSSVYAWEDPDGNPIEAKRTYTKRTTPAPAPAAVSAPAYTPPPQQIVTTSPTDTHHQVSDTATMIAQINALRASLIAKRDALLAQVAEINEALGEG